MAKNTLNNHQLALLLVVGRSVLVQKVHSVYIIIIVAALTFAEHRLNAVVKNAL
jgi:hypothetical protein